MRSTMEAMVLVALNLGGKARKYRLGIQSSHHGSDLDVRVAVIVEIHRLARVFPVLRPPCGWTGRILHDWEFLPRHRTPC